MNIECEMEYLIHLFEFDFCTKSSYIGIDKIPDTAKITHSELTDFSLGLFQQHTWDWGKAL